MYCGYIVEVKELRPHTNADRLLVATFFGNDVCVGLDTAIGDRGVYFPCDGQLSVEFCEANNLVRKKDDAGNNIGGYMDRDKRNVTAIKLRGEKSDGLYLPISCFDFTGVDTNTLTLGTQITVVNGIDICQKYIPNRQNKRGQATEGNRTRKKKVPIAPLFAEHVDTEQLAYNLGAFKPGDEIEITLKMHGSSQRTGYLPVLKGYKRTLLDRILRREGKPIYDWGYVSGTRRVVLEDFEGGYYGSNEFREAHSKTFESKLMKGETVYYEVVGFTHTGASIMGECDNKKLNDKDFVKQYGETTRFSYGCHPELGIWRDSQTHEIVPQSDIYVYRMTMTNEDGFVVEYTPDFMRYRCEQMGVKTVPVFTKVYVRDDAVLAHHMNGTVSGGSLPEGVSYGEAVRNIAEQFYDGPDPIGKTHVREGIVVRIINRPKFCAYKHKNWYFKALEGIVKVDAEVPDMEEAQEVSDDT